MIGSKSSLAPDAYPGLSTGVMPGFGITAETAGRVTGGNKHDCPENSLWNLDPIVEQSDYELLCSIVDLRLNQVDRPCRATDQPLAAE